MRSHADVLGQVVFDCVTAERPPASSWEERVGGAAGSLEEPGTERGHGAGGQRCDALLPSLTVAVHVRSAAEMDISAGQSRELGGAEPGLDGKEQQRMVAPASPGCDISARSNRFGGMASTRWITAACSGCRSAA